MESEEYKVMYEAEDVHWWYRGLRGVMATTLQLPPRAGKQLRILDAGCGTGGNLSALEKMGQTEAEGFDLSPIALDFCRRRGLTNTKQGSITAIPYPDNRFDVAISCDVLTDAGTDNEMTALLELRRVLKPGGRLFLNLPAYGFLRGEHDQATDVARRYTRRELKERLNEAGFTVRRISYWNMFLFPVVLLVRLIRRGDPEGAAGSARSDIVVPAAPINVLLTAFMAVERVLLRRFALPFGSSVAVVATKPRR
ncbi:MAG: class I SAM-dependent methyltransferase [Chloroflexota bacterium]|nr:class I SAM-dependent methyltransferase [Chloroflexota bacterium]